jgi:Xaa-Pro aminopeptidase
MRRGLISWSKAELPAEVLAARIARTQAAMSKAGVDALAVYTNPSHTSGVSWLSGFVPYWNHGVLVVPAKGAHTFVGGFSHRVNDWMKRTSNLETIVHSPKLGSESAKAIAAFKQGATVAIPDLDTVPTSVVEGIAESGARVIDGTSLFAQLRAAADPSELALAFHAAHIAHTALAQIDPTQTDGATVAAEVDGEARRLGAEEVYVGVAADLAKSRTLVRLEGTAALAATYALRISLAYKGTWVRMTRTVSRDGKANAAIAAATEQLAAAAVRLPDTADFGFKSWLIEGCRSTQPFEPFAGSAITEALGIVPGMVVSVQVAVETPAGTILTGGPALIGGNGESSALLVPPVF